MSSNIHIHTNVHMLKLTPALLNLDPLNHRINQASAMDDSDDGDVTFTKLINDPIAVNEALPYRNINSSTGHPPKVVRDESSTGHPPTERVLTEKARDIHEMEKHGTKGCW